MPPSSLPGVWVFAGERVSDEAGEGATSLARLECV